MMHPSYHKTLGLPIVPDESLQALPDVPAEEMCRRLYLCFRCGLRVTDRMQGDWCGARTTGPDSARINVLATRPEVQTGGCRHPLRKQGKGWPVEEVSQ